MMLPNWTSFRTGFTTLLMFVFWGTLISACRSFAAVDAEKNEPTLFLSIQGQSIQIDTKSLLNEPELSGLQEGMLYKDARTLLIQQGWQPHVLGEPPNLNSSIVSELFDLGYEEIKDCSGTGMGLCRFEFTNEAGELLVISSASLGVSDNDARIVWRWWIETDPQTSPPAESQSPSSNHSEASQVAASQLSLAGLFPGDEESTVLRQLGQPSRVVQVGVVQLEYPGLTLWLHPDDRRVMDIVSTSAQYCTPAGVCPGMDVAEVYAIYGVPVVAERENGRFLEYYSASSTCWLQIALDDQTVGSVGVACQP